MPISSARLTDPPVAFSFLAGWKFKIQDLTTSTDE
jgi:hypothetical protein